eukprot:11200279-Lingulodinium_polyedra.AAC.1
MLQDLITLRAALGSPQGPALARAARGARGGRRRAKGGAGGGDAPPPQRGHGAFYGERAKSNRSNQIKIKPNQTHNDMNIYIIHLL